MKLNKLVVVLSLAFIFGDHVKVIDGFYKGCTGTVSGYYDMTPPEYLVDNLVCKRGKRTIAEGLSESITEKYLRKIK